MTADKEQGLPSHFDSLNSEIINNITNLQDYLLEQQMISCSLMWSNIMHITALRSDKDDHYKEDYNEDDQNHFLQWWAAQEMNMTINVFILQNVKTNQVQFS